MNRNLEKLKVWATNNRLMINASKTNYMVFDGKRGSDGSYQTLYIGQRELDHCERFDYLGVRLDPNLSFRPHIQNVLANCNRRLVTLCTIWKYIDSRTANL